MSMLFGYVYNFVLSITLSLDLLLAVLAQRIDDAPSASNDIAA